ncbi:MAG: hypothetical protein GF330_05300 [Candidatus Eisenbacteria bacterium]|nr:hypothetical protein [Candidatus Eisenbacteria bacterium]
MLSSLVRACAGGGARGILGMNRRNRDLIDLLNPRRHRRLADDKILGKERLAAAKLPIARTFAVIDSMRAVSRIRRLIGHLDHFVIKPSRGRAGGGIAVLGPRMAQGWRGSSGEPWSERDIRKRLGDILFGDYANRVSDRALIEERIFAGPMLGDLPLLGLPDIRIITLDGEPVMGMVRLPTRQSAGKANLHLGAVGLGIDLEKGRTTSATWRHRPVTRHPETDQPLGDLPIAAWPRVIELARAAARAFPLRYLGIDVAITADGDPVVLEANVRPGLEIQNANRHGLRPLLECVVAATPQGEAGDAS